MEYRQLGLTGLEVSAIGLGTEFLVKADQETITTIVHTAIDHGVNYFDVLFAYPDYRDRFGLAFKEMRDRVIITGHLPSTDPVETCRLSFEDHLRRLQIETVDLVFVSNCDGEKRFQQAMEPNGHYELAAALVRQGKARYIAFSCHTVQAATQAVCSGKFDALMFPINPAFDALPGDTGADNLGNLWEQAYFTTPEKLQGGMIPERRQLYLECERRGLGLIAMKPFAAGWLFREDLGAGFTPLNLLHYALAQPGVSCVIPGAASLEQYLLDLSYWTVSEEARDYSQSLAKSRWNYSGTCMYCNHCQPCSEKIDIAEVNKLLDLAATEHLYLVKPAYQELQVWASKCQECGDCMKRCPFGVDVINRMKQAAALFE